ncbi:MAG TPA: hypothetical protein PLQ01_05110 [Methanothrix sp.]|nr:hypothetical protein [Methanothrix sp.]
MSTIRPRSILTRMSGKGLKVGSGIVAEVDLSELDDAAINVAADSIPFVDADDGGSKREAISDLVGAITGNGLEDTNGVQVVKAADASLTVSSGGVKIKTAVLKHVLADGTAAATDVTVAGMAAGDELISVHSQATKSSIATITDRTSEYTVGAGKLVKAAGTNETSNQLDIWYWDRT